MFDRVLVTLDGSKLAEQMLPYAMLLARGLKAHLELLRIIEPVGPDVASSAGGEQMDEAIVGMRAGAQGYLDGVAAPLKGSTMPVSCTVQEGPPAVQIVTEAERQPGTLVAMSTRGRSGAARWLLGSVTDKVLRAADCPLLTVRARDEGAAVQEVRLSRLIVPLDGSAVAEAVLPYVIGMARGLDLDVTLIRVQTFNVQYMEVLPVAPDTWVEEVEGHAMEYLSGVGKSLREKGVQTVEERLLHGVPAVGIVQMTREYTGSLVAMTTHGRSGLGRWIVGSVTDRVVRDSGAPVLVVRPAE